MASMAPPDLFDENWGCIHARGKDPGTCGRYAFVRLGGYDEDIAPTGYEDIDIMKRCHYLSRNKWKTIQNNDAAVGHSVPNDLDNKRRGLNQAKMANLEAKYRDTSFYTMNNENIKKCKERLQAGMWWRNTTEAPKKLARSNGMPLSTLVAQIAASSFLPVAVPRHKCHCWHRRLHRTCQI